jgi:hypothetical protein
VNNENRDDIEGLLCFFYCRFSVRVNPSIVTSCMIYIFSKKPLLEGTQYQGQLLGILYCISYDFFVVRNMSPHTHVSMCSLCLILSIPKFFQSSFLELLYLITMELTSSQMQMAGKMYPTHVSNLNILRYYFWEFIFT